MMLADQACQKSPVRKGLAGIGGSNGSLSSVTGAAAALHAVRGSVVGAGVSLVSEIDNSDSGVLAALAMAELATSSSLRSHSGGNSSVIGGGEISLKIEANEGVAGAGAAEAEMSEAPSTSETTSGMGNLLKFGTYFNTGSPIGGIANGASSDHAYRVCLKRMKSVLFLYCICNFSFCKYVLLRIFF
jgi:hypothetical protein